MGKFRVFLNEAQPNLRLFNPATPVTKSQPDMNLIGHLMSRVPKQAGIDLLKSFGISGRKSISKPMFQKFKYGLADHLSAQPDLMAQVMNVQSPDMFKPLIDYWKHAASQVQEPQPILGGNLSLAPHVQQEVPQQEEPEIPDYIKNMRQRAHHTELLNTFPQSGSTAEERFRWIVQQDMTQPNFTAKLLEYFMGIKYHPSTLKMSGEFFASISNNLFAKKKNPTADKDLTENNTLLYVESFLRDLANGSLQPQAMLQLLDHLSGSRIAKIRGDELQVLAGHLLRDIKEYRQLPKITADIASKVIKTLGNQRYFEWNQSR